MRNADATKLRFKAGQMLCMKSEFTFVCVSSVDRPSFDAKTGAGCSLRNQRRFSTAFDRATGSAGLTLTVSVPEANLEPTAESCTIRFSVVLVCRCSTRINLCFVAAEVVAVESIE